jgi:hypothetical protein
MHENHILPPHLAQVGFSGRAVGGVWFDSIGETLPPRAVLRNEPMIDGRGKNAPSGPTIGLSSSCTGQFNYGRRFGWQTHSGRMFTEWKSIARACLRSG